MDRPDSLKNVMSYGKVDYEQVKATESYQRGIQRLGLPSRNSNAIVLMCSEGKPEECHIRCKLIGTTLVQLSI